MISDVPTILPQGGRIHTAIFSKWQTRQSHRESGVGASVLAPAVLPQTFSEHVGLECALGCSELLLKQGKVSEAFYE